MSPLIACPHCRAWLLEGVFNRGEMTPCPACSSPVQIEVFPALFRTTTPGASGQPVMLEGESSCFYHPQKKATVPCAACGRFLCAMCDCPLDGEHYCPSCLESGKSKGKIKSLDNRRMRYDILALGLALLPFVIFVFFYIAVLTAPLTLYVVIRYWKAPRSLVGRNSFRFVLAAIMALLEIAGVTAFIITLASH